MEQPKKEPGVLSLHQIVQAHCVKHAHLITDVGNLPFHLVEPILRKKSANSLAQLEAKCPHLIESTGPIWRELLQKDFGEAAAQVEDSKCRETYLAKQQERDHHRELAANKLRNMTRRLNQQKVRNAITAVDHIPTTKVRKPQPKFRSTLLQRAELMNKARGKIFNHDVKFVKNNTRKIKRF